MLPKEDLSVVVLGRVESSPTGLAWRVIFPASEHAAASSYLRELMGTDSVPPLDEFSIEGRCVPSRRSVSVVGS